MLILTRKPGETIVIGDNVTVTVLSVDGNKVRIGTSAPQTLPVHRKEIFDRIRSEEPAGKPA